METPSKVTEAVKQEGFDFAEYQGEYDGWSVFSPRFDTGDALIGRPSFYLYKDGKGKWQTGNKASKLIEVLFN